MPNYQCPDCERVFSRRASLRNHVKIHNTVVDRVLREISEDVERQVEGQLDEQMETSDNEEVDVNNNEEEDVNNNEEVDEEEVKYQHIKVVYTLCIYIDD